VNNNVLILQNAKSFKKAVPHNFTWATGAPLRFTVNFTTPAANALNAKVHF
jgi:hypothetical protein